QAAARLRLARSYLVFARGTDETDEQRMPAARRRQELGVRLASQEPRMHRLRQLDHLHQRVVHGLGADHQAAVLELGAVTVVEFVAVTMPLADHVGTVQLVGQRAGLDALLLQAQAHGAAHVAVLAATLDVAARGAPLCDQADHRIRRLAVVLGAVGAFHAEYVACVVDHGGLHAVADAEVRQPGFARMARGQDLALEAAIAEAARYQDAVEAVQRRGAFALDLAGLQPLQRHLGALADIAVLERFGQRLVGVLVVDVLADDADG